MSSTTMWTWRKTEKPHAEHSKHLLYYVTEHMAFVSSLNDDNWRHTCDHY
jgi:hypothetical protein